MKQGIFNAYVKLVSEGIGISRKELFSSSRNRELANARYMLYSLCYERPMTINQIVGLMDKEGYTISYEGVRNGIRIINKSEVFSYLTLLNYPYLKYRVS